MTRILGGLGRNPMTLSCLALEIWVWRVWWPGLGSWGWRESGLTEHRVASLL